MLRLLYCALALCICSGCVTTGTFEAMQAEMQAQIDDRDARLAAAAEQQKSLEAKIAELKGQLEAQQASLAAAEGEIQKLNGRLEDLQARKRASEARKDGEIAQLQEKLANLVSARSKLASSVEEMKSALADAQERKAQADARLAEFQKLLDRFKPLIDTGKLSVAIAEGRMVVQLATDVLFGSGSASLSEEGKLAIAEVTEVLAAVEGRRYQVEGHTDNVPIRSRKYASNWELAAARATSVAKTMVDAGMAPERLSAASYGEFRPVSTNETREGRSANRRIEIVLMPDLSTLPGFEELNQARN